jgi:hypothetical protein
MNYINLAEHRARLLVDSLFKANEARRGQICDWPILGGHYVSGEEPIELMREMREKAVRALLARERWARIGPPDCQPLPLSNQEIQDRRWAGHGLRTGDHSNDLLSHIFAEFAITLERHDWDFNSCPSFEDFACGVMATKLLRKLAARHFQPDELLRLQKRYPPRPLKGLSDLRCFSWKAPKRHAKRMARALRHITPVRKDDLSPRFR